MCRLCGRGVITRIVRSGPSRISFLDLHALACGCSHDGERGEFCNFGDGWLDGDIEND